MKLMYPLGLGEAFSPLMSQINSFHDLVMVVILAIVSLVFFLMLLIFTLKEKTREGRSGEILEIIWTVLPCGVLVFLAAPSLFILYLSDEISSPSITVKVVGHQWYWSYEYDETYQKTFDSYMIQTDELWEGGLRLLEVDKRCPIPTHLEVRVLVTSEDVIHSWTVPSLGVKVDAIPGRLNQINLYPNRSGVVYGQCSEICGVNHAFMPICLEMMPKKDFFNTPPVF